MYLLLIVAHGHKPFIARIVLREAITDDDDGDDDEEAFHSYHMALTPAIAKVKACIPLGF